MDEEAKIKYHAILVETWRIFTKKRKPEQFSDDWWQEIIGEYRAFRSQYKGTLYDDYCGDLSMAFLNQHERVYKRGKQKRISQTVLPESQGLNKTELQCSDSVCQMGGFEEVVEPFT